MATIPIRRKELNKIRITDEDYKIAYDFANSVYKKFSNVVVAVVVFGSTTKGTAKESSDIDLLVIIDNVSVAWDEEVIAWYREELFNITKHNPHKNKLHINTITLSNFWDNIKVGDPAAINILRSGVALLDLGFFEPLKYLLYLGRIKPSAESIYVTLNRTPWHLLRARIKMLSAIEDFYWAMVDSAHAALMTSGHTPPSPEHVPYMLNETFVKQKKLQKQYVNWFTEMHKLAHDIKNNKIEEITGELFDKQKRRAHVFTKIMKRITKQNEPKFIKKRIQF